LEVVIAGAFSHEGWKQSREKLDKEMNRYRPQWLVINLLGYKYIIEANAVGALVSGGLAMRKLGGGRKTRVLAKGRTAASLRKWIRVARLGELIGEEPYSAIESALGAGAVSDFRAPQRND